MWKQVLNSYQKKNGRLHLRMLFLWEMFSHILSQEETCSGQMRIVSHSICLCCPNQTSIPGISSVSDFSFSYSDMA